MLSQSAFLSLAAVGILMKSLPFTPMLYKHSLHECNATTDLTRRERFGSPKNNYIEDSNTT